MKSKIFLAALTAVFLSACGGGAPDSLTCTSVNQKHGQLHHESWCDAGQSQFQRECRDQCIGTE
jgi:hypothetical protein